MTKAEIVERMAKNAGITKRAAEDALQAFTVSIRDTLRRGKRVSLVGFGTFSVGRRAARNGRNPQTGVAIKIKACKTARFRPGKALKDAVR
ncbi:MAG TPA: HU family DNA-binding protein [Candidatus Sulfotelmatobacter sp.]|nr:HU family DNA-binding protein [Candidatus Sulfotelmatobacter sp.]